MAEDWRAIVRDTFGNNPAANAPAVNRADADAKAMIGGTDTTRMRANLMSSASKNPDAYARALDTSKKTGLPVGTVERNKEEAERRAKLDQSKIDKIINDTPALAKSLEDPEFAGVAHDDLGELSTLEASWNALKRGALRTQQIYLEQPRFEADYETFQDIDRSLAETIGDEQGKDIIPGVDDVLLGAGRYLRAQVTEALDENAQGNVVASARDVGMLSERIRNIPRSEAAQRVQDAVEKAWQEEGFTAAIEAAANDPVGTMALSMELGLESAPQLAASAAVGAATRSPSAFAGSLGFTSGLAERMLSPSEFLRQQGYDLSNADDVNRLLRDEETLKRAQEYGFTRGAVIGAFDAISGGIAGEALSRGPLRNMILQTVTQSVLGGGGEAAAQYVTDGELDGAEVIFEALGEFATAPIEVAGAARSLPSAVRQRRRERLKAASAETNHKTLQDVGEAYRAARTPVRAADKAREFLGRLQGQPGEEAKLYIPAERMQEYFQNSDESLPDWLERLDISDQWEGALESGGDVVVDADKFVSEAAPDDQLFEDLIQEVRLGPGQMTYRESQDYQAQEADEIAGDAERMAGEAEQAATEPMAQVADDVRQQLLDAGYTPETARPMADLIASNYAARAERLGTDAASLFAQEPLRVRDGGDGTRPRGDVDAIDTVIERARSGRRVEPDPRPVERIIRNMGGVRIGSTLDQELRDRGLDPQSRPGLFRRDQGVGDLDNVVGSEYDALEGMPIDERGYVDRDELLSALDREIAGEPLVSPADRERMERLDRPVDDLTEFMDRAGLDLDTATNDEIKAALRDAEAAEGGFEQRDTAGLRGSFTRSDGVNLITVFQERNLSTFLHESGHFFLENLRDDAARSDEVAADLRTVQEWWQQSADTIMEYLRRNATTDERKAALAEIENRGGADYVREFAAGDLMASDDVSAYVLTGLHEQWARGFEAYLMEGRAPSARLGEAFERFKAWLTRIYRNVRRLDVELSDDVRGVMDRLVAVQDEIAEAEADSLFTVQEAQELGLTEAEAREYARLAEKSTRDARRELEKKILREVDRQETEWWKAERARVRKGVEKRVRRRPVYIALNYLQRGENADGDKANRQKLSRAALVEDYGEEILDQLPGPRNGIRRATGPYVYSRGGGVSHHVAAGMFGFSSGDHLVRELANVEDIRSVIDRETDAIMRERHGDMRSDGTIEREAIEAAHNDARGDFLAVEYQALQRRGGKGSPVNVLKEAARRYIANGKVGDVASAYRFQQAEQRAARQAERALAEGDYQAAVRAKSQQIFNYHLAREAGNARNEVDKIVKRMRKFGRKPPKSIDYDYVEQMQTILEAYNFKPKVSQQKRQALEGVREWTEKEQANGVPMAIEARVLEEANTKHYRDMTLSELRGLADTVDSIAHAGRRKREVDLENDRAELEEVVSEGVVNVRENVREKPKEFNPGRETMSKKMRERVEGYFGLITKARTWFEQMDGFKRGGFFDRTILTPIREAEVRRQERMVEVGEQYHEILARYYGDTKGDITKDPNRRGVNRYLGDQTDPDGVLERLHGDQTKMYVAAVNDSLTKQERLMVALNWGNDANRQRLLNGRPATGEWSEQQALDIIRTLDSNDLAFVQEVWDYIDSFWPEIEALERERTGVPPAKVDPEAFTVTAADGQRVEMRGGYFPIKYDPDLSDQTRENDLQEEFEAMNAGRYAAASTKRGHTKERVETVRGQYLDLNLRVVDRHLAQVVTDLTMYRPVNRAYRVLNHQRMKEAIRDTMGGEVNQQLDIWLKDTVVGQIQAPDAFSHIVRNLRTSVSVGAMGLKLSTTLVQMTGYTQTIVELGPKAAMEGLRLFARAPIDATRQVHEMSPFMKSRATTFHRDILDTMNQIKGKGWRGDWIGVMFMPIVKMQQMVDVPTWLGAYNRALREGMSESDAAKQADSFVEAAQSSGFMSSLSAVERGTLSQQTRLTEVVKLFTAFYSYFNAKLNIAMRRTKDTNFRSPKEVARLASDYVMLFWVETVLGEAIMGQWPDDEEDDMAGWMLGRLFSTVAASFPIFREGASVLEGFSAQTSAGRGIEDVGRAVGEVGEATGLLAQGKVDDIDGFALFEALVQGGNVVSPVKYPASQINTALAAAERSSDGEDVPMIDYLLRPPPEN